MLGQQTMRKSPTSHFADVAYLERSRNHLRDHPEFVRMFVTEKRKSR